MRNSQGKKKLKNLLESWPILIILFFLILFFTWQIIDFWGKMQDTKRNRKIAEEKVIALKESKKQLETDIAKLETNQGVEETIRNKFGLVKEGEGVIVIVEDQNANKVEVKKENSFFSFFKNLFR
jgi:cell division protein FtsB